MSLADSPIRYPDTGSRPIMTRRGWWLVGLNILIPGSAQSLAGNHRLGRLGLGATLALWALVVVAFVTWLVAPAVVYTLASNSIVLWLIAIAAVFYAVLWVVLTFDTLRLVRLVKTVPAARGGIAALAIAAMVLVSGGAAYGAYVATTASGFLSSVFVAGPSEPPVDGRYNVLLLGGDAGPDREGLRPDSIRVVSIDAETGQAVTIGLPRDLTNVPFDESSPMRATYPDGYGANGVCDVDVCQLNSIYTEVELKSPERYPDAVAEGSEPGIEAMRDAAEGITGLTIQYYVLIDMAGFQQLIDALGGVTVEVPHDVPIHADETFTTVAEWIPAGEQHLDGYHALWYARSRHGTSDYDRMARQLQIQEAVLAQFNAANVLSKFQDVAAAGSQVVKTDVPQSMLGYFVDLAGKTRELPIVDVPLVPDNGVDPLDPDYEAIRQMIETALIPPTTEPDEG
ncbi:LCP family protein [Agromyces kandeliae]|uniref:LytR family transcriptional regulator n=1 Tax=Agromyces kandeliae TaxID=2666141 RepID=A0A6L5QYN4_9MICO|nr:LCP family protein [Agromyces kandeliae]MRX42916.1 LytR family transcriptional regulator [Agromyces kandeliae]